MTAKNQTAEAILIVLKRIILWVFLGFVGFILFIFIFIYSFKFNFDDYKSLQVISELNGISLNQTVSDFLFKNEGFKKELFVDPDEKENKDIVAYSNERYFVYFVNQKVKAIEDDCQSLLINELGTNGIICGDSSEKILSKYKSKVKVLCGHDNLRLFLANEYNVAYTLKKNIVVQVRVEKDISDDKSWVDCKDYKI